MNIQKGVIQELIDEYEAGKTERVLIEYEILDNLLTFYTQNPLDEVFFVIVEINGCKRPLHVFLDWAMLYEDWSEAVAKELPKLLT
ncbi:MAG: hypothetical protein ACTSYA_07305 [Candidatus Kariarchaeaceae archaeon]